MFTKNNLVTTDTRVCSNTHPYGIGFLTSCHHLVLESRVDTKLLLGIAQLLRYLLLQMA